MILSVGGTITGAVGFELQQFLLPLTFLQLHYADLQTHTPEGAITPGKDTTTIRNSVAEQAMKYTGGYKKSKINIS